MAEARRFFHLAWRATAPRLLPSKLSTPRYWANSVTGPASAPMASRRSRQRTGSLAVNVAFSTANCAPRSCSMACLRSAAARGRILRIASFGPRAVSCKSSK